MTLITANEQETKRSKLSCSSQKMVNLPVDQFGLLKKGKEKDREERESYNDIRLYYNNIA